MQTARCSEPKEVRKIETISDSIATELSELIACFENPVCVYAADVAKAVERLGGAVTSFDSGPAHVLEGFRKWDITRPVYVASEFDLIVCAAHAPDVDQLFHAMRVVTHFDFQSPLLIVQPEEAAASVVERFHEFGLKARATRQVRGRNVTYLANFDLPIF